MISLSLVQKVFAQDDYCQRHPVECGQGGPSQIIGTVTNPLTYGTYATGLVPFFNNVLRLVFVVAGIYALLNFIIAGYQYMTAGGDSKMLAAAWNKIWQSLLGLLIIVSSFVIAAIFGQLLFGDAMFILNPKVYGP